MELVLFIMAYLGMCCLVAAYYKKLDLAQLIVYSFIGFFSFYVIVSGILFWIDIFSIARALIGCIGSEAILIMLLRKSVSMIKIDYHFKSYRFVLILSVVVLIFSFSKFELFGMRQDQGVYQTKALELMYGNTANQIDFEEYQKLSTAADRQSYVDFLSEFIGYYMEARLPTFQPEDKLSDVSGYYHGIPTFAAMLALFGKCFGINNMSQFQTIFFLSTLFLLLFSCRSLEINRHLTRILLVIYTFSPIVIWVSKSALTESFLGVLLAWFFYLLVDKTEASERILFLPILVLSIYHISCYTLMPMFFCIFVAKYIYSEKKVYLWQCAFSIIGFLWGYTVSCIIAPQYSYDNSAKMMIGLMNYDNLLYVVWGVCILLVFTLFLFQITKIKESILLFIESKFFSNFLRVLTAVLVLYCLYQGHMYGWHMEGSGVTAYYGTGNNVYQYLTLSAYIFCTGLLVIPLAIVRTITHVGRYVKDENYVVVLIGFFYLFLFLAAFLRTLTHHYYYYARYTAPMIMPIFLYCGVILDGMDKKYVYSIGVISTCVLLPFDYVLATEKDDTRLPWNVFEEVADCITENDAIVVGSFQNDYIEKTALLAWRAVTGADIYPYSGRFSNEMVEILNEYENVYYLAQSAEFLSTDLVYQAEYCSSEDYLNIHDWILPLPSKFTVTERDVQLWKIDPETFDYLPKKLNHSTRNGTLENGMITSDGTSGWLLYGPYMTLEPGTYTIQMKGSVLEGMPDENSFFDIVCDLGTQSILEATNLNSFLNENKFNLNVTFTVEEAVDKCEFRIYVNEGLKLEVDSSVIQLCN